MWTFRMHQLALASLAAFPFTTAAVAASTFISPQRDFGFALNIPDDASSSDLFFSMVFPVQTSWVAVGLGASTMKTNPLVLMAYPSASGKNVTISPRRCYDHSEPIYDPDIDIQVLPGTGLLNDTALVFNGVCSNCRSWPGNGMIDIKSTAQIMAYGTGPVGNTRSDNPRESVKVHWSYGSFTMDMVHATGDGGAPVIPANVDVASDGVVQQQAETGHVDTVPILHAVIMILVFVGIWPFGVLVLRVGSSVRWHAITQGVALGLVVIGSALGFATSTSYTRSMKFNTAHQIIGIFVLVFALAQFTLGYLHHRIYKRTQQTTKMAPIHVWLGRFVIPLGVANGFTGFPLALSPVYNFALLGIVLFIFPTFLFILLLKRIFQKWWQRNKKTDPNGYNMEPWHGGAQPEGQYQLAPEA
ncbi:iron reductase domain protein [Xylariaceae sp. FL1651]|nr:iron reductase domain protein [Xylariaceae sp. FL1651]